MGQAKQRGSFEERRKQSIEKTKVRAEAHAAWWASLTDEQRQAEKTRQRKLARGAALFASMAAMGSWRAFRD